MNKAKLYSALAMREMHVNDFLSELNEHGLRLSKVPTIAELEENRNSTSKKLKL